MSERAHALTEALDDAPRFRVFADGLSERGDPRGELISVQLQRETQPDDVALAAREARLLEDHLDDWLGPLARELKFGRTVRGAHRVAVRWRRGFLDSVRFGPPLESYDFDLVDPQLLRPLLGLESSSLLRELVIGSTASGTPASWQGWVDALAEAAVPATLRRLEFNRGGYFSLHDTGLGELSPAQAKLQALTSLRIELGAMDLGTLRLAKLQTLELFCDGLTVANVTSIVGGQLPALETLSLEGTGGEAGDGFEALVPLFEGHTLERVHHLGLANSTLSDQLAAALPGSKILQQLVSLDLSRGVLTDEGARALLAHRNAFAHLEQLDLSGNLLTDEVRPELEGLSRRVLLADQHR